MLIRIGTVALECDRQTFPAIYGINFAGEYDPIIARLAPQDTVLDAGACIGAFSIPIARRVKRVYALEPHPDNFQVLCRNIMRNKATNVVPMKVALTGIDGESWITGRGEGARLSLKGERVRTMTLDTLSATTGESFSVLKVDIEGTEVEALVDQFSLSNCRMAAIECEGSYDQLCTYLKGSGFTLTGEYGSFMTRADFISKVASLRFIFTVLQTPLPEVLKMSMGMLRMKDPLLPCSGNGPMKILYAFKSSE